MVGAREIGSEFTPDDAFVPTSYAAHAATVGGGPLTPATPVVLVELEGYFASDLPVAAGTAPTRKITMFLERPVADGLLNAITRSNVLLDNLGRRRD